MPCQKAKADRHAKSTKLSQMPTGSQPWQEIAMDFVGELPESEGYNAILVVTDRFTKAQRYIPTKTSWTAAEVADAYIFEIYRHFGMPAAVTSDRGPQFASAFLRELTKKLNIWLRLSTAHHPQTDGLSEHAIQTLKQYLRIYTHDRQDNWARWLPLAEFAYNSTKASHGYSPFQAMYGWDPQVIHLTNHQVAAPAAEEWLDRMISVHNQIHHTLRRINDKRSKISTEKSRQYHEGDKVMVDRRNLAIKDGTRSLSTKWLGPFTVTKVISRHAYKLDIPANYRLHNVIHTSLLKPFRTRP